MPASEQPIVSRTLEQRHRAEADRSRRAEAKRIAPLTLSIEPGDTEHLFKANYSAICDSFKRVFADLNAEPRPRIHSPGFGTTIEIFVNLVAIGGGIVAAEMLKEITKDLWNALKDSITSAAIIPVAGRRPFSKPRQQKLGYDNLKISLPFGDTEVTVSLSNIGPSSRADVRRFVNGVVPALGLLVTDLAVHNGWTGPPLADRSFRIVPNIASVDFSWTETGLVLRSPICIACDHLETPHEAEPCWTCSHHSKRTGGRIDKNAQRQFPPKEGDHFRSWADPRLFVPSM
jgi:hypothetical protein